ncbi:hypothetical protein Bca4012_002913 [Brassica carinata]
MMFQVSDVGHRDVETPSSNNGQDSIGSMNKKHPYARPEAGFSSNHGDNQDNDELPRKRNYPETEKGSSSRHSCIVADVTTASSLHTYTPVFLTQDFTSLGGLKGKGSPKRIISSMGTRFVTFTLAPVDVRHCRLRLPMQFSRENGINKPGKIYLLGNDGSKWLANLLQESRGRMTVGDGWKSFVKANGLKIGESYTLELNWEDTTPVLSLCPTDHHSVGIRADGECSEASENESLPIKPSSGTEVIKYDNRKDESSSWEREKNHLRSRDSSSASQNRFLTLTITPDSLRHGRLRLPLEFMTENSMNRPGDITLLGKDGAKWLASLLLERRGRMCLGKGWKDFAKANGLKTGDSITLESIWEDSTPVLRLLHIESTDDRRQQDECSKAREKESAFTEPSSGNKTRKLESNREESRIYPLTRLDSSLVNQNRFETSTVQLPRKKKAKKNNPGTEADSSPERSCFVAHHLPQDFTSSNSPTQIVSSYLSSEKQLATFTLAPVDVRNCRLRLPMQFTRENGINKPGKIYLLGKDGSKWLANLLLESRGRMTLGDGWKSFVKANGLKTGESFTLKLNWEDATPVLSLCPPECSIDSREGGECSETIEKEPLPIVLSCEKEISKDDENRKKESSSWERETNLLIWRDSTVLSQNRCLTLTITPDSLKHGRLRLPLEFMTDNSMNKPGEITLLGKDGVKWLVSLLLEKRGRMSLGKGWKDFAKANGLKTGDSITLESIWENATPVLSLLRVESSNDSEVSKQSGSSSGNKTRKAENRREGSSSWELEKRRYSSSAFQNRIVILTLTPEGVRDCKLQLPSQFMRTNGIMNPGKITLLGRSGMKWFAYLLSKDGTIALENGWKGFCEANGVMVGESFVLELIPTEDADHVFKFYSNYGYHIHKCSFLAMSFNLLYLMSHMRFTKFLIEANAETADTQGHATDFVARFFSHAGLMSFISISRVWIYKACGRTVNPINRAIECCRQKLECLPSWVEMVIRGGSLRPIPKLLSLMIRDIKPPKQNIDDDDEVPLNKKVKTNIYETEADSCLKAFLTDSSLHTDTLHFTSSNALSRNCSEAHSAQLSNEDMEREREEDESLIKKKLKPKQRPVSYSSYSPCHKRFVTFTLPPEYSTLCRLTLPNLFVKENGISTPAEICVLGKDGTKWPITLLLDKKGIMSFGKGWKEFVKANGLETGFTLKLMWEDTTPSFSLCCPESASDKDEEECLESIKKQSLSIDRRIRDKPGKRKNNKEEKKSWEREKIHLRGRDVGDFEEVPINKKVKTDSHGTDAASSSLDNSCFVAFVTDSSLDTDTLYLPRYFTSSNGLTRKCLKIVLIDGGGRSWAMDLSFNESSDIFYISPGWRSFCDKNGLEAGGFFTFKLVGNEETPVLSFCPMVSIDSRSQKDCFEAHSTEVSNEEEEIERERNEEETLMDIEEKKKSKPEQRPVSYSSYSPCYKRFITFTLPPDYATLDKLTLPKLFVKENGINKPGEIYLLGKDGTKWLTRLLLDKKGLMRLGKGWKDFVKANGVESGFTLKLIWEDATPSFSLCCAESTSDKDEEEYLETIKKQSLSIDRRIRDKISKVENDKEEKRSWEREKIDMRGRDSTTSSQKDCFEAHSTEVSNEEEEIERERNEEETLMDIEEKKKSKPEQRPTLPKLFVKENGINKPGEIYLLGKDGTKWLTRLLLDKKGLMRLGKGWKDFVKANGVESGFTLKLIWEDATPSFSLCCAESTSDKDEEEYLETIKKQSLSIDRRIRDKISKVENDKEEKRSWEREKIDMRGRDSTTSSQKDCFEAHSTEVSNEEEEIERERNEEETLMDIEEKKKSKPEQRPVSYSSYSPCYKRFITFTLPPDYATLDKLTLPKLFVKENGINKPGEIYLLGKDGTKWLTRLLLDKKGLMRLGKGWKDFVKANGVESGFTLKLIWEDATPSFSLCCAESTSDKDEEEYLETIKKQSLSIDRRIRDKISKVENDKEEKRSWEREKIDMRGRDSTTSSQKDCFEAHSTEVSNEEEEIERERNEEETLMDIEEKKKSKPEQRPVSYSSYSPCYKRFITFTLPPDYATLDKLTLPKLFVKENGINKPGEIYLLGKDGTKWLTRLLLDKKGLMRLGKGWKDFVKANGVESGFTLKLIWEDATPSFSLCCAESTSDKDEEEYLETIKKQSLSIDRRIRDKISKVENDKEEKRSWEREKIDMRGRDSTTSSQKDCFEAHSTEVSNEEEEIERERNEEETLMDIEEKKKSKPEQRPVSYSSYSPCYKRFITFTLPPDYATLDKLTLPKLFVKENGINKPGEIYLLGKDGTKWLTRLLLDKKGLMRLGKGWKDFVKANGVESGFTLKLIWEDATPSFSLCCAESTSDKDEEEYLETIKKQSLSIDRRIRDKISKVENDKEEKRSWEREKIDMRGRDSTTSSQKQFLTLAITPTSLRCNRMRLPIPFLRKSCMDKPGVIYLLGKDDTKWMANLIQEGDGRMKLGKGWTAFAKENEFKAGESVTLESIWEDETPMIRFLRTESESSKANKKESIYTEDTESRTRDSSTEIHARFVTLTLKHEDVKACMLILPSQFLKANGINKLGKITLLDENEVELSAYLLSREGIVAVESGWGEFCEANGVKLGESFTLECIKEQDETAPVLKVMFSGG